MNKLIVLGHVPNTDLFWEKLEYEVWLENHTTTQATDYLLVNRGWRKREVVASLDMGQLVALRASIDALVAAEAEKAEAEK